MFLSAILPSAEGHQLSSQAFLGYAAVLAVLVRGRRDSFFFVYALVPVQGPSLGASGRRIVCWNAYCSFAGGYHMLHIVWCVKYVVLKKSSD